MLPPLLSMMLSGYCTQALGLANLPISHRPSQTAEQVPCTVWTLDGTSHVVRIDMAATVKDVTRLLMDVLGMSVEAERARDWKLCGIRGSTEDAKHRFGRGTPSDENCESIIPSLIVGERWQRSASLLRRASMCAM